MNLWLSTADVLAVFADGAEHTSIEIGEKLDVDPARVTGILSHLVDQRRLVVRESEPVAERGDRPRHYYRRVV